MEFDVQFWHWIVLGIALMLLEIALPSFTALWFGAAAILVGILVWLMPNWALTGQLLTWAVLAVVLTVAWFKYLKPLSIDKTKAGLGREALIGEIGQVLSVPHDQRRGKMRLPAPILGSDEWLFICQDELTVGDRVRVVEFSGNSLIVTKHQT